MFTFKVWKTVKLGTGLTSADDFRHALKVNGCKLGGWANDILGKPAFTVSPKEIGIDLVVATTKELTGKDSATTVKVFSGAARHGLEKCPAEVGPQLRLQYKDQPLGEWLFIGMEPITDSDGYLSVFNIIAHSGFGLCLYGAFGSPRGVWDGAGRWVFALPKR